MDEISTPLTHAMIQTNDIQLHVVQAGPKDGPLVILLHGFPEFWYGWRAQIAPLVEAGYCVWIPDQRGYHRSDKPSAVAAYHIDELVLDIVGLIDASGRERCAVVGHDWGGVVAWSLASDYSHRLERVVAMNVPHISVMIHHLTHSPRQLAKSWYIVALQLPWLAERLFSAKEFLLFRKSLEDNQACSAQALPHYLEAWSAPGALTAMFNWYRACRSLLREQYEMPEIDIPALLLWGAEDRYLGVEMGTDTIARCRQGRYVTIPNAGHFIQHQAPEVVNSLLLDFLQGAPSIDLYDER